MKIFLRLFWLPYTHRISENLKVFYNQLSNVALSWEATSAKRDSSAKEVIAVVEIIRNGEFLCPVCKKGAKNRNRRIRGWHHLDFRNHKALIEGIIPCIKHEERSAKQLPVSRAEEKSR